jgi:4-amino-4-deoxy-L-arabinose transferase-like glycosyltransferase
MSIEGFYKSSYFLYERLQALTFKIAGISDFTARFPSAILQLGSVILMYLIPCKLTKNKYVGLISAAVL